jgi:hypothetical protein
MDTTIPYAPMPSKPQAWARWLRFILLGLFVACFGFAFQFLFHQPDSSDDHWGMGLWGTPIAPMNIDDHGPGHSAWYTLNGEATTSYYVDAAIFLAMVFLGQWLFLLPRGSWRIRLNESPRPMKRAAIVAGAMAMLLTIGLVSLVLSIGDIWEKFTIHEGYQDFRLIWIAMLVMWTFWSLIFLRYFRTLDGYTAFTRVFRYLFAGTVLEMVAAAPVFALTESTDKCYCAKGSYTTLVFAGTCALWLFGPGIFLLYLREKRRMS